jgi:hypothetical protein
MTTKGQTTMSRRSPEQVHEKNGHPTFVASCARCVAEAEQDSNAEQARDELATGGLVSGDTEVLVGEQGTETIVSDEDVRVIENAELLSTDQHGNLAFRIAGQAGTFDEPLPDADQTGYPDDAVDLPVEQATRRKLTTTGRPACYADGCPLPEFSDGAGLCGAHWSLRPDLRKKARHG